MNMRRFLDGELRGAEPGGEPANWVGEIGKLLGILAIRLILIVLDNWIG